MMFCHNCGKQISMDARHCMYCGALRLNSVAEVVAAQPDAPARAPLIEEECLFKIRPAFHAVAVAYLLAALLTVLATVLIAFTGGSILWVWAAVLVFFAFPLYRHLQRNHTCFTLSTTKIEIEQGLFSKTTQNLALRHINNVAINQSLPERLVGIGDVLIDSAGMADKMALKGIRNPHASANQILAQMQRWK